MPMAPLPDLDTLTFADVARRVTEWVSGRDSLTVPDADLAR